MSQAEGPAAPDTPGTALVRRAAPERAAYETYVESVAFWVSRHRILLGGLLLIAAQFVWRAQFLSHQYFFYQDFFNLNLAIRSPFSWHYLTYVGSAHLIIGERAIVWMLARISLYGWGLASAVCLAFVLAAGLAALRLLRTLFGDRPAVLILLAVYLLTPLTVASLGWWTAAMESVPLQMAIFLALNAQVWYVRTGRPRHLASAALWVAVGMLFFEKGLALPLLLFAVTALLVCGGRSWLAGARQALSRYWRAWLLYAGLMIVYAVVLTVSLRSSITKPQAPGSAHAVLSFAWALMKDSFLPGAIGGPWRWLPIPGGWYALAAPPAELAWLAVIVAVVVVGASIWRWRSAWRAWAILMGWIVLADMLPVVIARLNWYPILRAWDTRYVADAVPVLAICLGLALLPTAEQPGIAPAALSRPSRPGGAEQSRQLVAAALLAVFVVGSIWSAQAYGSVTTGRPAASYIANASLAIEQAPRGTPVFDEAVSGYIAIFAKDVLASTVIGDIQPRKLRWIRHPAGTIDGLRMFGADGRLYPSFVYGTSSLPLRAGSKCWPVRHGQIVLRFWHGSPAYTGLLRIGYLWFARVPGTVTVHYGNTAHLLVVEPGLHAGYVPVTGSADSIAVTGVPPTGMCVGDAEAGNLGPVTRGGPVFTAASGHRLGSHLAA